MTTWSSGLVRRLPRTAGCVALNNTRLLRSAFVLWQRLRGSILKPAYILATVLPRGIVGQPYPWMGKEHPAPSQVFTAFAFLVIGPTMILDPDSGWHLLLHIEPCSLSSTVPLWKRGHGLEAMLMMLGESCTGQSVLFKSQISIVRLIDI